MNNKIRAAIYTRVSTFEQAREGYSLEAQRKVSEMLCKMRGYIVVGTYSDEGISGKDIDHRPEMQRLITDAEKGKFDVIVVWKLTRFTRRLSDLTTVCERLDSWDVQLVSCTESFDSTTPAGKMMRNMLGTIAQFEREVIAENVKLGLENRASKGKRTCSQVLGYDLCGKDSLSVNTKEANYVRFVYESYLVYKCLLQVAYLCRKAGYSGKRGRQPTSQSILVILTNPLYIGYNKFNGRLYRGNHPHIIDTPTWNKVQTLLKRQGKLTGRPRIHDLPTIKKGKDK